MHFRGILTSFNIFKRTPMIVGRKSGRPVPTATPKSTQSNVPDPSIILEFVERRDFTGALTFIDFYLSEAGQPPTPELLEWRAYCLFHTYEYAEAAQIYARLSTENDPDTLHALSAACSFFLDGDSDHALEFAKKCQPSSLLSRLMMHLDTETTPDLELTSENIISTAARLYSEGEVAEALSKLQCVLTYGVNYVTVFVFIAMCQFRLGNFEQADEALATYLEVESDSGLALNLKACIMARMLGREMAEAQLLQIRKFGSEVYQFMDAMLQNNMVVFSDGENGFDVLPKLMSVLPEARINLQILYARKGMFKEAKTIMDDNGAYETEQIMIHAAVLYENEETRDTAAQLLEAAVPPGDNELLPNQKLCEANAKLIRGDYDTGLLLLSDLEETMAEREDFQQNKGMALAALGRWEMALPYLMPLDGDTRFRQWKCACFIHNDKAEAAWDMYVQATGIEDSKVLLKVIATECYETGNYFFAMRAFDVLSKFETDPAYSEGLVASAVGCFRGILLGNEDKSRLTDVLTSLSGDPAGEDVATMIREYIGESDNLFE